MTRICNYEKCNKPLLETQSKRTKYCLGGECYKAQNEIDVANKRRERAKNKQKNKQKKCCAFPQCETMFTPTGYNQKYCHEHKGLKKKREGAKVQVKPINPYFLKRAKIQYAGYSTL